MTPNQIKQALTAIGAKPNKKLGQHFLISQSVLETVVTAADIHAGDRVLEVGPGLGVLTGRLLDAGAEVTAIEQDRLFASYTEQRFSGKPLTVVQGDASTAHWHEQVGSQPWKFVSNLPYHITSLALRKALWAPNPASRVVVLIQREVAERVVAKHGKTSLLSLMAAFACSHMRIVRRVPAGAFFPPPKVQSAVLELFPLSLRDRMERWNRDPEQVMALARRGFAHPRKQLAANLADAAHSKQAVQFFLKTLSLNPRARAEDLSPKEWAALADALFSGPKKD